MTEYHKIQTVFLRDPATKHKHLLDGEWSKPEFRLLADAEWEFTEKVDGTNIRLLWDEEQGHLEMRGRTDAAQLPKGLETQVPEIAERFHAAGLPSMTVYAEGFGAKIQKGGGLYRPDQGLALFDARVSERWWDRPELEDLGRSLSLEVVPVIGRGSLRCMVDQAREGFASAWGDAVSEGIVARPAVELRNGRGERVITKIKARDFPR